MTNKKHASARTEVDYSAACRSPYLTTPLFVPGEMSVTICREGAEPEPVPMTFVVFRAPGADEDDWEDDPMMGQIDLCALGEGDEEVEPVQVVNLGCRPADFVAAEEDGDKVVFRFSWSRGDVTMPGAREADDGFEVARETAMTDEGLPVRLEPYDGEPFTLRVRLPRVGFTLRDAAGQELRGDVCVTDDEAEKLRYIFTGTEADDRFSIVLEEGKFNYLCVLQPEEGRLAVRDQRERLALVAELPAEGTLKELLMGAQQAMVKNKNERWRIQLADNVADDDLPELSPVALARHAFTLFSAKDESAEDAVATELLRLEDRMLFQWWWLKADDWSHERLDGLLDMSGIDEDPEKLMRLGLLYNRYDAFMRRLAQRSLDRQTPIQGDQLQARNNKRKIARQARRRAAHDEGSELLWSLDEEARREVLYFSTTFHREFLEACAQK